MVIVLYKTESQELCDNTNLFNHKYVSFMKNFIYDAAMELGQVTNHGEASVLIANDVCSCVKNHALIAVGAAWIPLPGADVALMAGNTWAMYLRINNRFHISFSDNVLKSIGSAILGNLTSNIIALSLGSFVKFIPGASLISGAFLSALVYATTLTAAWVYLRALARFYAQGDGSEACLRACVDDILSDRESVKNIFNDAKSSYRK